MIQLQNATHVGVNGRMNIVFQGEDAGWKISGTLIPPDRIADKLCEMIGVVPDGDVVALTDDQRQEILQAI